MARRLFQWLTIALLLVSAWTAYANVFSDDTDVRARARATVNAAAGCGDDCRLENMRGERGMLEERIEYSIVGRGHYVVACRRAYIVAGDHTCEVKEGAVAAPSARPSASVRSR